MERERDFNLSQELPQTSDASADRELVIEERESVEKLRDLLEVSELAMARGCTIAADIVDEVLLPSIERARALGRDVSLIRDLEERVMRLKNEAPLVAVRSSLEHALQLQENPEHAESDLAGWYWQTKALITRYRDRLPLEDFAKIEETLSQIERKLGVHVEPAER